MSARLYSLFHKVGKSYIRQTGLAYTKQTAVRVFQNALIYGSMEGKCPCLRAVKHRYTSEQLEGAAAGSNLTIHECCKLLDKQCQNDK